MLEKSKLATQKQLLTSIRKNIFAPLRAETFFFSFIFGAMYFTFLHFQMAGSGGTWLYLIRKLLLDIKVFPPWSVTQYFAAI